MNISGRKAGMWLGKGFLFLIIFFSISSCSEKTARKEPAHLIPPDSLVVILADLHLADAFLNFNINTKTPYDPKNFYDKVLEKHKTDRIQFSETITYYSAEPEKLDSLYDLVLNNLSTRKAELMNSKLKEEKK
jgi:hypothetical protein